MILTEDEITLLVYKSIMASDIPGVIDGDVYYGGDRPKNSEKEDITLVFTTGGASQMQEGIVTVLAYVKDLQDKDGTYLQNRRRTMELGRILTDWGDSLGATGIPGFLWKVKEAPRTFPDREFTHQHFVSLALSYKVLQ